MFVNGDPSNDPSINTPAGQSNSVSTPSTSSGAPSNSDDTNVLPNQDILNNQSGPIPQGWNFW